MKVFLSALDTGAMQEIIPHVHKKLGDKPIPFGLQSYFYIRKSPKFFNLAKENCSEMLIDSGAHSFQHGGGKNIDWIAYTKEYAQWIKENDNDQILGYFEMDIDNVIGYDKVLELRKILLGVTDKIIPVWHKNRGIEEFKKMCKETKGEIVSITGFGITLKDLDIKRNQYDLFVKYAHENGKKIHGLGLTRSDVLLKVPFDFVDSSSWSTGAARGGNFAKYIGKGRIKNKGTNGKMKTINIQKNNLIEWIKFSKFYNRYWHKLHDDLCVILRFGISRLLKLERLYI